MVDFWTGIGEGTGCERGTMSFNAEARRGGEGAQRWGFVLDVEEMLIVNE